MSGRASLATSTVSPLLPGAVRAARAALPEEALEGLRLFLAPPLQEGAAFILERHEFLDHLLRRVQRRLELSRFVGAEGRADLRPLAPDRRQLGLDGVD